MLEQIKAVIFDLDGTLVDSMWMWKAIDMEYLTNKGVGVPEDLGAFQDELEGMGFTETAVFFKERFGISDSLEEIKETWISMAQDKYCREVPLKPGAEVFLRYLRENGIKVGISSSNSRELIQMVLKAHGIEECFDCITTCCEVPKSKPAPDVYLKTAQGLQVPPENCLVFEDVPMGILAGKRAGMKVCAIEDAFSKKQEAQKRELADWYIEDYREILEEEEKREDQV
nr:HAD family phosphatase [uncultured Blautia sp.]